MKNKAVFLDRDGTIAKDVHYCRRVEDFEMLPSAQKAVRLLNESGFKVIVITNQSGIARGYFTEETLSQIHKRMSYEFTEYGAWVDAIYYCPHHPDDNCECRKPNTALFHKASVEHDIDFKASYVVGDRQMDIDCGRALGCKTIIVTTGPNEGNDVTNSPDCTAGSLLEAAEWLVEDDKSSQLMRISQQKTTTAVSVVVLTYNEEENISECLDSLFTQDYGKDKYEVIVVDGGSKDKTQEICHRYPVKLVVADRKGFSYQRNKGIETSREKYIAFTDADCVAQKSWLRKLVEQIESSDEDVVAVGGPNLVFQDDSPFSRIVGYTQETFLGSGGSAQSYRINNPKPVNSIANCNIIYRKEVIAKERYDENLVGGDDCDLNFRLRLKGYKFLYFPDIIVWHRRPKNLKEFVKKALHYGEVIGQITRKHKKVVRWYAFPAAFAVLAVVFSYPVIRFFPVAIYIYAFAIFLYVIGLVISTVQVHRSYNGIKSLMTFILLPIQHLLYGFGFLKRLFLS